MKKIFLINLFAYMFFASFAQEHFFKTSDNVDLYVNVKGEGMPCLYLHGGPGADSHFLQYLNGEALEQRFQMIYLDQRGCGRSSSPENGDYSMARMIQDFEEIREHLKIDKWLTLGHSFGGLLQMGYVLEKPEVINGMMMINCSLHMENSFRRSWIPMACNLLEIENQTFYLEGSVPDRDKLNDLVGMLIEKDLIWKMSFASREDNQKIGSAYSDMKVKNNDFGNVALNIDDYQTNFLEVTANVKVPVLFFYGTKDWCVGPLHYQSVAFPNVLFWRSNTEHMSPFLDEQPELNKAIDEFRLKYNFIKSVY